jgi:hypothetical protein
MKQATLCIAFIAVTLFSVASPVENCTHKSITDSSLIKKNSMQGMLQQILNVVGITNDLELKEANVLNIEAKISHKKRYILYNPSFITDLNNTAKDKWSVIALLAHEVGHHLKGHTIHRGGSKPKLELEADEFAGFVLNKLGATVKQAQNVMYFIAKTEASKTHPSRGLRLSAIEKGWNKAADLNDIGSVTKN